MQDFELDTLNTDFNTPLDYDFTTTMGETTQHPASITTKTKYSMSTEMAIMIALMVIISCAAIAGLVVAGLAYQKVLNINSVFTPAQQIELVALAANSENILEISDALTITSSGFVDALGFTDNQATSATTAAPFIATGGTITGSVVDLTGTNATGSVFCKTVNMTSDSVSNASIVMTDSTTGGIGQYEPNSISLTLNTHSVTLSPNAITVSNVNLPSTASTTSIFANGLFVANSPAQVTLGEGNGMIKSAASSETPPPKDITPAMLSTVGSTTPLNIAFDSLTVGSLFCLDMGGYVSRSASSDANASVTLQVQSTGAGTGPSTWDVLASVSIKLPQTTTQQSWSSHLDLYVLAVTPSGFFSYTIVPTGFIAIGANLESNVYGNGVPGGGATPSAIANNVLNLKLSANLSSSADINTIFLQNFILSRKV